MEQARRTLSNAYKWIDQFRSSKDEQSNRAFASEYLRQNIGRNDGTQGAPSNFSTTRSRLSDQSPHMRMLTSVCSIAFGNIGSSRPSTATRNLTTDIAEEKPTIRSKSDEHEKVNTSCSFNTVPNHQIQSGTQPSRGSNQHKEGGPDFASYKEMRMSCLSSLENHEQPCEDIDEECDIPTLPDSLQRKHTFVMPDDSGILKGCASPKRTKSNLGSIKMSVQYFSENRQLRVIIMSVEDFNASGGTLSVNISLNISHGNKVYSTSKKNIVNKKVSFKQALFIDADGELSDVSLKVAVLRSSKIFRFKKTLGVASVPLGDLNLYLDTTILVNLKPKQSRSPSASSFEVVKGNSSMVAQTMESLYGSEEAIPQPRFSRNRSPRIMRSRSLPVSDVLKVQHQSVSR